MTIKELETRLAVQRATIRFYEKEGLISPERTQNGYRDYSKEDVERLKKIIVFRKIGMPITEIADVFDGAKSLPDALQENESNLMKQMEELQGAIRLNRRMVESELRLEEFNADDYLNYIEIEEKDGSRFMDIAMDIVKEEKGVLARFFSATDRNGNPYDSWIKIVVNVIIVCGISGCILSLYRKEWSWINFRDAVMGIVFIILVELLLSIPLYFLGKKNPKILKNRNLVLSLACLGLCIILLIISFLLQI